ncbi:MAG: M48 family metallopeptidase [Bacteroidales bacterium]|nr:M48 family metallopeptidase [Bacteroidales bacterium]
MAKSSEKMLHDPDIGEVMFRKSLRSRSISIRVHPVKGVSVSVPFWVPYSAAKLFFQARRGWILETMARQREKYKDAPVASSEQIEALRRQAKAELPPRLAELAGRYGFTYNRVTIKHNATNWGSCSAKSNINLNLNIVRLPRVLQDYVLLHELCHLRHQDHGHAFHLLLEHVLTDNLMRLLDSADLPAASAQPCSLQRDSHAASGISAAAADQLPASDPVSNHAVDQLSASDPVSNHAADQLPTSDPVSNHTADRAFALSIARKAAASKARYPLDYTMTRAIKQYRVI